MLTGRFATQAASLKNLPYDPLKDFAFIGSVVRYPMVYAVRPHSPITSFKDYIDRAKAAPNTVTNAVATPGSVYHLLGKWIDNTAGTEITLVFYRGTALAVQDVLAGRVDVLSDASTSVIPRIKSGQLRALAVSSAEPYPLLPGVPTMGETVPGIKVESSLGMAAPAALQPAIVDKLNGEVRWALGQPEVKKWARNPAWCRRLRPPTSFGSALRMTSGNGPRFVVRNNIVVQCHHIPQATWRANRGGTLYMGTSPTMDLVRKVYDRRFGCTAEGAHAPFP